MRKPVLFADRWFAPGGILFASLFLAMCNTVETVKVGGINLKLDDSLTVEAGRYDSLEIDILEANGTMRLPRAFHGKFTEADNGVIKGIPLGENPPADYRIQLRAYKDKELVAIYVIQVTGSDAGALASVPLPPVKLASLAFEPATLSLQVGETSQALQPRANPGRASNQVALTLDDATKADILAGNRLLAKSEGLVRVTATSLADPEIKAELAVTITAPPPGKPLPRSVLISKRSLLLAPGGTAGLDATILPDSADQRIAWKSDHAAIAEVVEGVVTAKVAGKTFIRAASFAHPAIYDSIPLEVVVPQPFDSVRLSRETTRFFVNGPGQKIGFTIHPSSARAILTWSTGDAGILTVDADGTVTARSAGDTWVKAAGVGNSSLMDSMPVTVVRDPPRINAGPTQSVDPGKKATFNVAVEQEFGAVKYLRWDLDGDGTFEGSATSVPAVAEMTYPPERKEYLAVFKAEDIEGNTDSISVRVRVGFNTPLIIVTRPTRDTLVRSPDFTVAYTVDGTPKTQDFTLTQQGRNRLVIIETKATGTDSVAVFVTLDSQPPVVRIQSPLPGLVTNRSTLRVDWTVDSIPQIQRTEEDISAREGQITITREATDEAGNPGSTSVVIVRDVTKPRVAILRPRNGDTVSSSQVAVEWTVDDTPQTTQLTEVLAGADGEKFITRKATDAAGNTDSVTVRVLLDASRPGAPVVTVDPAASPTQVSAPTWSWTASGAGTGDFQYKLGNNDFSTGATATRALTFKPATPLTDGVHTLYVREKDAQGTWGPIGSATIEVDTRPAVVVITAPLPGARITSSPVTVTWTVDGGTPQTNTETLTGPDGAKTITRTGTDRAGNPGSASVNVVLDLARPATPVFLTPASSPFNTRTRRPAWTWQSGGGDAGGGFRYQLGTATPVELPGTAFTPSADLADGAYTLRVAEKDAQGNWSTDAVSTVNIKGSAPAAPTLTVNAAYTNAPRWSWSGTTGATFGYKLEGAASFISEGTATFYQPTAVQMGEGLRTVCVQEKDIVGYGAERCQATTVDRTNPVIALGSTYSAEALVTSLNLTFNGTVSDANLDRVECRAGSVSVNATINAGNWSCTPALADGTHNVTFTAFDRATNSASATAVTVHKHSKVKFVRRSATGNGSGTSWANAYTNIEDVLKTGILASGDSVWISRAVYPPRSGFQTYVFTSNTTLLGGFSNTGAPSSRTAAVPGNVTEIDASDFMIGDFDAPITNLRLLNLVFNGQINTSAPSRVYVTQSTGIRFENCTFKNFMSDVPLFIRNESDVTVSGSYFQNNWTGTYGAICVNFSGGFVDISNTFITGNTSDNETYSGGVTIFSGSSAKISNSTISGNRVPQKDLDGNTIGYLTVNMYVSGRVDHSSLTFPDGGSSVRIDGGVVAPPIP